MARFVVQPMDGYEDELMPSMSNIVDTQTGQIVHSHVGAIEAGAQAQWNNQAVKSIQEDEENGYGDDVPVSSTVYQFKRIR